MIPSKTTAFARKVLTLENFKRRDILLAYFSNLAAAECIHANFKCTA